jgi:hypothetical protein
LSSISRVVQESAVNFSGHAAREGRMFGAFPSTALSQGLAAAWATTTRSSSTRFGSSRSGAAPRTAINCHHTDSAQPQRATGHVGMPGCASMGASQLPPPALHASAACLLDEERTRMYHNILISSTIFFLYFGCSRRRERRVAEELVQGRRPRGWG